MTACCSVPCLRLTLTSLRRASSIAFCTATGTSRALPLPMPMLPSPSPTTVSAANPSTRPPFTTLVTRLTATIFSRNPSPRSSCCCTRLACILAIANPSEFEPAGPCCLGKRLDAAVVPVAGAVERDALDARGLRFFGNALAYRLRSPLVAAAVQSGAQVLLQAGGAGKHLVAARRSDLRVDVAVGTVYGEPHRADLADLEAG